MLARQRLGGVSARAVSDEKGDEKGWREPIGDDLRHYNVTNYIDNRPA